MLRATDETLSPEVRPGRVQSFYDKGNDVIVVSNHINVEGDSRCVTKYVQQLKSKIYFFKIPIKI